MCATVPNDSFENLVPGDHLCETSQFLEILITIMMKFQRVLLIQDVVYGIGIYQYIGKSFIKNAMKKQMKCFDTSNTKMPCIPCFFSK